MAGFFGFLSEPTKKTYSFHQCREDSWWSCFFIFFFDFLPKKEVIWVLKTKPIISFQNLCCDCSPIWVLYRKFHVPNSSKIFSCSYLLLFSQFIVPYFHQTHFVPCVYFVVKSWLVVCSDREAYLTKWELF